MFLSVSCSITGMNEHNWERLGRYIVDRRVSIGLRTREALASKSGLSARLLGDIEKGRRTSYSPGTLAVIEQALGWASGSALVVADGGEPGYIDAFAGVDANGEEASLVFADGPEDMAKEACQSAVSAQLKSPSSASFTDVSAVEVGDAQYNVRGYVDADNSFGAALRTNFVCRNISAPYVTADDITVDD